MPNPTAHCYIDGFNLFYGALKGHDDVKWLDLRAWCARLLPAYDIERVVYCTARTASRPDNPGVHQRQDQYIRALSATGVEVVEGNFRTRVTSMLRAPGHKCEGCDLTTGECPRCGSRKIRVLKTEEKGSDVNLAVELVQDVYASSMDAALVVSGDSDLQRAVDIAMDLHKRVFVLEPRNRPYAALIGHERRRARHQALVECQLPNPVVLPSGTRLTCPEDWY